MMCGSCGVRNVDFASTCFSCRQPLGKLGGVTASAFRRDAPEARKSAPRATTRSGGATPSVPGGAFLRLLLVAAVAWVVARGFQLPLRLSDEPATMPTEVPSPRVPESAPQETMPHAPEELNGFRLVLFEWSEPAAGPDSRFRVGETVSGLGEIQGFGVTTDQSIDVTVALAFRDPTGTLVEPISPTVLRQPKESDTLFTSFDYAIPADRPAGTYDLEIAVDDAVSTRSVRFHRSITVEAAEPR
jgi:hypothetical protein